MMPGQSTVYAIGIQEALGFACGLVLLMLAGFGGLLRYFIQNKFKDLQDTLDQMHEDLEQGNNERRQEVAAIKEDSYKFKLYVEQEFVKKTDYAPAIARLHERFDQLLKALAEK